MVAVLKQIEVRPAIKPRYLNRQIDHLQPWYRDNEPALGEYWLALSPHEQNQHGDDFREFVLCQYDIEYEREIAARETTYGLAVREF